MVLLNQQQSIWKHFKELQGTFKPTTRNYKVLQNQLQGSWKQHKELQGAFKPTTR